MMRQFEVMSINGGEKWLVVVNTDRWNFWLGFRSAIKRLS